MTQTIEHNFTEGTVLEVYAAPSERHRVVEAEPGTIHDNAPVNSIPTRCLDSEGDYADFIYPEDIVRVVGAPEAVDPAPAPTVSPDAEYNVALARFASDQGVGLKFRYAKSKKDAVQTRTILPDVIYTTKHGDKVIVGLDPDRQDVRAFRLDRILGRASV